MAPLIYFYLGMVVGVVIGLVLAGLLRMASDSSHAGRFERRPRAVRSRERRSSVRREAGGAASF